MDRSSLIYIAALSAAAASLALALGPGGLRPRDGRPAGGGGGDPAAVSLASFSNFESGQVHPVDITPDGTRLLVCNTADARLEVFDITSGTPLLVSEIPVGLDPISVRARTADEAWVVNTVSDSVSVVSLSARNVVATLKTRDEPSDVVFAGAPQRAFVSCSQVNGVQVFDPANLGAAPTDIPIKGKEPRALAVSPDGQTVYCAVFSSGNATTVLGGSNANFIPGMGFPPNVVTMPSGPYAGQNPPPNQGASFSPPRNPAAGAPPAVSLIVRKDAQGRWMDDNNHDWTAKVSGPQAADSGRIPGWDMPDRDLAFINASSLSVTYARGLMNICAAIGVNPATGDIAVVGTDATNEVRFEPNLRGRFVHVLLAIVDAANTTRTVKDLNPHLLPYALQQVPQAQRDRSIGDPRAVAWRTDGSLGYITGLGSNNVVVVNAAGDRAGLSETIEVGEGPTGLALDEPRGRRTCSTASPARSPSSARLPKL
jgi:DNA-binding beta-propeller fold protein YncE